MSSPTGGGGSGSGGNPHKQPVHELVAPPKDLLPESMFTSLPWTQSITGEGAETLLYMPFVEAQMRHLEVHGGFVRELPVPESVAYTRATKKAAHMGTSSLPTPPPTSPTSTWYSRTHASLPSLPLTASFCVETEDFRKIRFTYMDGGKGLQVFNSVWYPRFDSDAPILGVDLLLFGGGKMLAVVDFQPLSQEGEYKHKYLDQLAPIKAKYPALNEVMSNRYYQDTRWFSEQMLFGRFQETAQIQSTLYPAFQEYMAVYSDTVRRSRRSAQDEAWVLGRHKDYDEFQLTQDPAHGLFQAYYGAQFANDMMLFQFELADPALLSSRAARPMPPAHTMPSQPQQEQP